jgi:hypothetical protein
VREPVTGKKSAVFHPACFVGCDPPIVEQGLNPHVKPQLFAAFGAFLLLSSAATGQTTADGGPDPTAVRVRLGPLAMTPSIDIPTFGVDTNVFHDPPTRAPKRDFTMTVAPKTDMWLRMGRTWLSGTVAQDVVWYQKYSTERSANYLLGVNWKAPLNRVVLSTGVSWLNTRTRPGFEIDARVRRREPAYAASAEVRGFAKTFVGVRGSWRRVEYEEGVFLGQNLSQELDRTMTSGAVTLRHELTPLTSITFSAGRSEQRFASSPRSSRADDYSVSVNFDPAALLKGAATFGYTNYRPDAEDVPGYKGATVDLSLAYALLGSTRLSAMMNRAVEFSYDSERPYYVLTGGSGSIAQRIFGPVDVVARAGTQRLRYQSRVGVVPVAPERTDRVRSYGGGIGFRLGEELRLGVNVDKERRTSPLAEREYEGLKYGASLTYGL